MTYIVDRNAHRFVARDKANKRVFYPCYQSGLPGQQSNTVRVDESLNVTIHRVVQVLPNGQFRYDPAPLDYEVTWS